MVVPPTPETVPPQSFASTLAKVRPARGGAIVVRSSVNATTVAGSSRSKLLIVNSSVTALPGGTGSSVNSLVRWIGVVVTVEGGAGLAGGDELGEQVFAHVAEPAGAGGHHVDRDRAGSSGG